MDTQIQVLNTVGSIFSFVLGAMIGSFLNVCIHRLPRNESVVKPRSKCPKCENSIAWYDNIPMISWLVLAAKCRNCGQPISWQYPLVEAITGALFFLVFWRFGFVLASPIYMLLCAGLVLVTFVDLADWTIPNEVTFPGVPLGIVCSVVVMFYPDSGLHQAGPFLPVYNSLLGVLAGGGILYLLDKLSLLILGKRGMGFGDVKLLAMLGAFFGLYNVLVMIFLASCLGSIVGVLVILLHRKNTAEPAPSETNAKSPDDTRDITLAGHYLPFGPYLAVAGLIVLFLGPQILQLYTDFFSYTEPLQP